MSQCNQIPACAQASDSCALACRHLRQALAANDDAETCSGGGSSSSSAEAEIDKLLGGKAYKARLIHKLIMLEDAVFLN